jgi:hypothetical protein
MSRRVPYSIFGVSTMSVDELRQHARRLLQSGYNVEATAELTGLSVGDVRAIAETPDADDLVNRAPSP